MVEVPERKVEDGSAVTAEPSTVDAAHEAVFSERFGSNSTEGGAVIAEVESTIASRSGETEAEAEVVTERTRENLESEREETFGC